MNAPATTTIRAKILALVNTDPETMRAALDGGNQQDTACAKLTNLTVRVGLLASYLQDAGWRKNRLRAIYGFATGWLMLLGTQDIAQLIHAERERQQDLLRAGKFTFTCASPIAGPERKLCVLVEEIGEVAEAIDHIEIKKPSVRMATENLRDELIQVAAVAVAWLESLEAK